MQLSDKPAQIVEDDTLPFFYPCVYLLSAICCLFSTIALLPIEHVDYSEVFFIVIIGSVLLSLITSISFYLKLLIYKEKF